ncbi:MAG: flagellar biosynthesis protein FlhB [Deltaproteobacteria bacterium]|nr:flagellar biosynthesis protein FlhB [Deltaproteobacteria bacterium]
MADDEGGEKTHEPTAKRQQEFREKGNVPKSQDLYGVVTLAIGIGYLLAFQSFIGNQVVRFTQRLYGTLDQNAFTITDAWGLLLNALYTIAAIVLPMLCSIWMFLVVAGLIQSRFIIPKEPIKFQWETLNPIDGIKKKFFSAQPLVELLKGILKLVLLGWLVWMGIGEEVAMLPSLIHASPEEQIMKVTELATTIFIRAMIVGILVFLIDYSYQWYQTQQQMMMTHQEVKDEMKQTEGDPLFKSKRRQRQYDIAMGNLKKVPEADLILTNPTHFAVAIRYRRDEAEAPIVLAKGLDFMAFRIREIAQQNKIMVVENPPLARALYFKSTVGQMIPPEFYGAVAEILAAVYRRRMY